MLPRLAELSVLVVTLDRMGNPATTGVPSIVDAWSTDDVTDADEVARRCAEKMYAADRSSRHLGIEIGRALPAGDR